jgi:hypothetical protein
MFVSQQAPIQPEQDSGLSLDHLSTWPGDLTCDWRDGDIW